MSGYADDRAVIEGVDVNLLPELPPLTFVGTWPEPMDVAHLRERFDLDFKPLRTNTLRSEGVFGRALRNAERESGHGA